MSNPYSTPIKLRKRDLDGVRKAIAEAQGQLAALDARDAMLVALRRIERGRAAGDLHLAPTAGSSGRSVSGPASWLRVVWWSEACPTCGSRLAKS